jgi:ABC-type multidrug transport system permease subunit
MTNTPTGPNPLAELLKARLREFWREKGILFWVFGFPILMTIGLGIAFRSRPPELPRVGVVLEAPATAPELPGRARPQALAHALVQSPRLSAKQLGRDEAQRELKRGKIDVVVELGGVAPIYTYDALKESAAIGRFVTDDVLQRAAGRTDPIDVREVKLSELGSRYIDFLLPGLIGLNLMGSSMWGVGYNFVLQRKRRLLRRFAVTPMRRYQLFLAYFIARALLLVLELGVLVAFGALAFGTVIQGSFFGFLALSTLGAAAFAGIGLLIGARVENTEAANGWMNLVQLPMWVLSGAFFSYERFPEWLHEPIRLLPLTSLVDALRAIYNDGAGLFEVRGPIAVLVVWGTLSFVIALKTFRWQ